jgi:hypothetical protein
MDKFFYKYTTLRPNFFKEPMLRATPFRALNDPFEGNLNKQQVYDAIKNMDIFYAAETNSLNELEDSGVEDLTSSLKGDFYDVGIISFTEDFTNPLMWAHYADEHRGMVIEFNNEEPLFEDSRKLSGERKCRFGDNTLGDTYEFPQKVIYRREIPSFERLESMTPNSRSEYHWKKFLQRIFFTKANDWIYEKEMRSVLRLCDADKVICEDNENIRRICSQNKEIMIQNLANNKIEITYPIGYEMDEEMGDESVKQEIYHFSLNYCSPPPIHLFRINPKAISGVYLGCNSDHEAVLKSIEDNSEFNHLKKNINKMKVDDFQYQLNAVKITI